MLLMRDLTSVYMYACQQGRWKLYQSPTDSYFPSSVIRGRLYILFLVDLWVPFIYF